MVDSGEAVEFKDFLYSVYRPRVQALGADGGVLDLEACFYVFYWGGDEGYCGACHDTRESMAH